MALTEAQLATIRNEVGSTPDDPTLQSKYDRVGTLYGVAYEVVSQRLADLRTNPASFTVVGEYSQNVAANIATLEGLRRELAVKAVAEAAGLDPNGGVTVTKPVRDWAR